MIRQALQTSLRSSSDIWQRGKEQLIFPSSALRIADHHLHASGIIPTISSSKSRLYEHDWFCVSQAVACEGYSSSLLCEALQSEVLSNIWVASVGSSSIRFGNIISIRGESLAKAQRVFVRKQKNGKSAPFSNDELSHFRAMGSKNDLKLPETLMLKTSDVAGIFEDVENSPVLKVTVGPQHVNFGNHADHAFLLETAFHALYLALPPEVSISTVAIQYVAEVFEGDQLNCIVSEEGRQVFVAKTTSDELLNLVAIARIIN